MPGGNAAQRCSVVFQLVGSTPLTVGDRVSIGVARIRYGNVADEIFIVISRPVKGP